MKTGLYIFAVVAVLLFAGCQPKQETNVTDKFDLHRLVGRWKSLDEKSYQIEEWTMNDEWSLKGKGFVMNGADTTYIEFLSIKNENGQLVYSAQVSDQNGGETVPFKLTSQSKDFMEFSNPTHDFPKRIVYRLKSDAMLQAYIEGPRDNRTVRVTFDFMKSEE
jgi:hypothetical protein